MTDISQILTAIDAGDSRAAEQLLPLVYDELRKLAKQKTSQEKPGQTLQATALVHEAYLRLMNGADGRNWNNRSHFFAAAAEAMRRILIDNARRKRAQKRGGDAARVELSDVELMDNPDNDKLLAMDEALEPKFMAQSLVQFDTPDGNQTRLSGSLYDGSRIGV